MINSTDSLNNDELKRYYYDLDTRLCITLKCVDSTPDELLEWALIHAIELNIELKKVKKLMEERCVTP